MGRIGFAVFMLALSFAAFAQEAAPPLVLDNTMCPVMTDEPVDAEIFVEYQGKRVYFCCTRCQRLFGEEPEKYLERLPQFAAASPAPAALAVGIAPGARLLRFLGKFHPVVVHFPIGLLLAAALAQLCVSGGQGWLVPAVRFCLAVGAVGAVVAAGLGWISAGFSDYSGRLAEALFLHRWLGTATALLAALAWALYERQLRKGGAGRGGALLALFAAAALVGLAGHFGGSLIYGLDYYTF